MANTYFKIEKEVHTPAQLGFREYTNNYSLSLTAFVGKAENLQITIAVSSDLSSQSGFGYIVLTPEEVDKLIIGLLERRLNITATGIEKSLICPAE